MAVTLRCACGHTFRVAAARRGKPVPCPGCGAAVRVPAPRDADAGEPEPTPRPVRRKKRRDPTPRRDGDSGPRRWLWFAGGAGVLAAIAGAVFLVVRLVSGPGAQIEILEAEDVPGLKVRVPGSLLDTVSGGYRVLAEDFALVSPTGSRFPCEGVATSDSAEDRNAPGYAVSPDLTVRYSGGRPEALELYLFFKLPADQSTAGWQLAYRKRPPVPLPQWKPRKPDPPTPKAGSRPITAVAVIDSRRAVAAQGRILRVWDLDSLEPVTELTGHTAEVTAVAARRDGHLVVSASPDGTYRVWDLERGQSRTFEIAPGIEPGSMTLSAGGGVMLAGNSLGSVTEIESISGNVSALGLANTPIGGGDPRSTCNVFAPDDRRALAADGNGGIVIWDTTTGGRLAVPDSRASPVRCAAWSPDDRRIVAGFGDGSLMAWDVKDKFRPLYTIPAHRGEVAALAFTPDGGRLVSVGKDGALRLWRADTGGEVPGFRPPAILGPGLALTTDGRKAVCGTAEGRLVTVPLP